MSTTILDPTVADKLQSFGRRRFRMLVLRGICAAVVTFLLCIAVVSLIDWYWVLSDRARWLLSSAAYVITAGVVWTTAVRKLLQPPGREELAVFVEDAEPELRENLLSAVELATDDPATVNDSPVFRGLLQGKVALQMAKIHVPNLLPLRMLAKWMFGAAAVLVVLTFLMSLPDPRFRTLAVRAMLPGANIDRVSRIHVEVLQPTPNSIMIAKDETVAVVVEVSGGDVSEVILETFTPEGSQRQSMRARDGAEYVSNLHIDESVEYRILAGDAVTRRHSITAKGRPQVVAFHKTFRFPEYSGLPNQDVTETTGDLIVLEGTQATLQLDLDQDVSAAELRIDGADSEEVVTIPLTRNDAGEWAADVSIDEHAIYKVHLVSSETGFENIFSPRYEIRPVPDLIPRAGFVDQQETNLLLPPNDILALKGMAEDDLPLVSLTQEISVNGREWVEVPLKTTQPQANHSEGEPADEASRNLMTSAWDWDLIGLKLKTGDQITTRLVATDRKGNRGESVPLRIVVSAPDFDPQRHAQTEKKAALYDSFADLAKLAEEHNVTAADIIKRLREERHQKPEERRADAEQALDRTNLADLASKLAEASGELLAEIHAVTLVMPTGADAYDLELSGRAIARLHHEHCTTPNYLLTVMQQGDEKLVREAIEQLKQSFDRSADDAKSVANHYQQLISHNLGAAVAQDLDALLRQQKLVVDSPTQTWTRLVRQETVVMNQLLVVERLVGQQQDRLSGHIQNVFKQLLDWSRQRSEQLERAFESEERLAELQRLSQDLMRELNDRQRMDVVDNGLSERLNQARRDFDYRSGTLSEPLSDIGNATREENRITAEAAKADDSTKAEELLASSERFVAEVDLKHRSSLEQLRTRRTLMQARQDGNPQFAADAGLTHRAVTSLLNQHRQGDPQESIVPTAFQEIAPAYRVLESGHDMKNAQQCLVNLIQLERWSSQELQAGIDHPRQWDVINKGIEEAVNKMRAARIDNEIVGRIDQVRWSAAAQEADRKLQQRRWVREEMVAAGSDLIDIRDQLKPVGYELDTAMAAARAIIAKYAPTIPQMAQQAADQLRQLEEETTDAADAVEQEAAQAENQPEQQQPQQTSENEQRLADLQEQQQRINHQIDDLVEALVEDANSQDLMVEDQRERARDADDSIAMVQDPAKQMNEALQEAEDSDSAKEQAQELSKAAEQQERAAQALEKVAEHFDRLEQGLDVAETRAELREQERELGIARQMDQRFEQAQELAEMAQQNPEDLLQELEQELAQNPAMQQALSEISQNTIQEARNALQDAAQQEQELQRANELSDEQFQEQKKQLAEDLRELGQDAAELSQQLVNQAKSAASQAKTPEAQKKFEETQQKLNEAANAAKSANEGELKEDLVAKAQQTKEAIKEASEAIQKGKEEAAAGKNEEVHPDDKNRENAKRNLEKQRKDFNDQRKRAADAVVGQEEGREKQQQAQVQNAERNLKKAEEDARKAQDKANQKPDDNGAKNAAQQAEARLQQAQQTAVNAVAKQQQAQQKLNAAREERNELNSVPEPQLNDKNPAAQLAEAFAQEAAEAANQLNQRAEELAKNAETGEAATPVESQLANAADRQERVAEDVEETAENVARAARHERRLQSAASAKALQQASDDIQHVADNEATQAQKQLEGAAEAAAEAAETGQPQQNNQPAVQASQALAQAEQALSQQAEALSEVLEQAAAEAAAAATAGEQGGEPQGQQPSGEGQPAGEPATGEGQPGQPTGGEPQSQQPASSAPQSFTPEEMAAGMQLAQTLDELDRQQAAAAAAEAGSEAGQTPSSQQQLQNLAQAARAQQAQMAAARVLAQQQAALSSPSLTPPEGIPAYDGQTDAFAVLPVNRQENEEWGKLREQAAEDLSKGRREKVSEEYRKSVETYFRVLAERARRKQ